MSQSARELLEEVLNFPHVRRSLEAMVRAKIAEARKMLRARSGSDPDVDELARYMSLYGGFDLQQQMVIAIGQIERWCDELLSK